MQERKRQQAAAAQGGAAGGGGAGSAAGGGDAERDAEASRQEQVYRKKKAARDLLSEAREKADAAQWAEADAALQAAMAVEGHEDPALTSDMEALFRTIQDTRDDDRLQADRDMESFKQERIYNQKQAARALLDQGREKLREEDWDEAESALKEGLAVEGHGDDALSQELQDTLTEALAARRDALEREKAAAICT